MKYSSQLTHPEIERLFKSGRKLDYKRGEIIQHANEAPKGVYFIEQGYVKEYTLSKTGNEHFNIMYEPGEMFSFIWAFMPARQNVFRQAHTDVRVWLLAAEKMQQAMATDPELLKQISMMLMTQMYFLKLRVENLAFSNAYDKVAYCMLYFAGRYGERHKNGWYITLPFRHQHVADALSMSRETASRMIARMEKKELIKQDGRGHFVIRDPKALANTIGIEDVLGMWPELTE